MLNKYNMYAILSLDYLARVKLKCQFPHPSAPSNCQSAQGYEKNYSPEKKKGFVTVLTKLMQSAKT